MNPDTVYRLRKNFCLDANLNFASIEDPYFNYYLDLYEEHYKSRTMWNLYQKDLDKCKDHDLFLCNRKRMIDSIFDYFHNNQYYLNNKFNFENIETNVKSHVKRCVGDIYMSIDLKEANFLSMNYLDKNILLSESWDQFIRKFEDSDFLSMSKQFRQFIFGKLNGKTQAFIQKKIISDIFLSLKDIKSLQLVEASNDELIFCVLDLDNLKTDDLKNFIVTETGLKESNFRFQFYTKETYGIKNTIPDRKVYLKTYIDISTMKEIKNKPFGVPSFYLPQFIKYITKKPIERPDLLFRHEDSLLAKFDQPLQFQHLHLD